MLGDRGEATATCVFLRLSGPARDRLSTERVLETVTRETGMQRPVEGHSREGRWQVAWSRTSEKAVPRTRSM